MGQALYRKYRSKNLDEVIGQDHITATLKNALKSGKISHAYLLTGPRGVGKTSVARILAHEVNGFKYDEKQIHLDIIEIDAASNRRIDEIRDLRDKVHIAPTTGKYKIYIIDEVHMLTKEAFNALLKTLEEPPEHVIFILATTEAHKLPQTIVSRTQRFSFKPVESAKVIEHLRSIAKNEGIKVDDEALELIAEHGDGSFRDSISMLDQASAAGKVVTADSVKQMLGIAPQQAIDDLIKSLETNSPKQLLNKLSELKMQGYNSSSLASQLSETLRNQLLDDNLYLGDINVAKLLKSLINVPASSNPDRYLEVVLLDEVLSSNTLNESVKTEKLNDAEKPSKKDPSKPIMENIPKNIDPVSKSADSFDAKVWPQILADIKVHHNTLYSIMRMSQPSYDGKTLTLSFAFDFHNKRLNDAKYRQIISDVIKRHTSDNVTLVTIVDRQQSQSKPAKIETKSNIESISNIFGTVEVLDS